MGWVFPRDMSYLEAALSIKIDKILSPKIKASVMAQLLRMHQCNNRLNTRHLHTINPLSDIRAGFWGQVLSAATELWVMAQGPVSTGKFLGNDPNQ